MNFSVNLLLYKPSFYLKPCLDSLLNQSYRDFELLVIDNNSGDGTAQRAEKILNGSVKQPVKWRVIANTKNLGFAKGHNLGIKESEGEFILFMNQDLILNGDFLKNIIGIFSSDEKAGAAQGKMLRQKAEDEKSVKKYVKELTKGYETQTDQRSDKEPELSEKVGLVKSSIIDTTGLEIFKNRRIIARGQGQEDKGQFDKTEEIFGVDGSLPVYRRSALEDLKISGFGLSGYEYFDEDFSAYKEDVDLAWRLRLAGWKAYYIPDAVAWHARTSGDSAKTNYWGIIKERRKIEKFPKLFSFKNQRLMQIKNEQPGLLLKHIFHFFPKEAASWIYVILFERFTWRAFRELIRQAPTAFKKRKIIMAHKKIGAREMKKWFK